MPLPERAGLRSPGPILFVALAATAGLLLLHARLYGSWINDDAGISFTYARNLAEGHGLVLNPGGPRVEGYSNPAWVFLLGLLMKVGLFDPVMTPKIMAFLLASGTFYLLARVSGRIFGWPASPVHALPGLILAGSVPFVGWAFSGLENSLFLFLLALGLHLHLGEIHSPGRLPWSALVFVLLAITRPEGILYGGAALVHKAGAAAFRAKLLVPAALWALIFATLFAGYQLWHYQYFADPFPNTYYAKVERGTDLSWRLQKEVADFESTGWKYVRGAFADLRLGFVLLPCLILALVRFTRRTPAILLLAAVGALNVFYAVYVGGDWMEQYRFMGPLLLTTALLAAGGTMAVKLERDPALHDPAQSGTRIEGLPPGAAGPGDDARPRRRRFAVRSRALPVGARRRGRRILSAALMTGAAAAAAGLLIGPNRWILGAERTAPSVSFAAVAERGRAFGSLAQELGLGEASLMDPDLGGTSWASGLRMVDLGGLADPHISRYGYDPRFFVPYVLEEQRPTFLRTHCVWSRDTRINENPRFREDYVPIWERPCPLECCREFLDGEYVRRDVFVAPAGFRPPGGRRRVLGELVLEGEELDRTLASPGDTLRVSTWWSARGAPPGDLRYVIVLRGPEGEILSEEREFARSILPPGSWKKEEMVRESFTLGIPAGAARAKHRLLIRLSGKAQGEESLLAEIEIDAGRAREEAEDLFVQHQRASAGGEYETALGYIEAALALRPHALSYETAREAVLADLAEAEAAHARELIREGRYGEAADRLLAIAPRTGRKAAIEQVLEELAAHFHRSALALRSRPDAFLHWSDALAAFRRALECDPGDSEALVTIESLRGREYVQRTWGADIRAAHEAPGGDEPVSRLLEHIQDEGFEEESWEVIAGSAPIGEQLRSEGTLGSLALLHQAASWSGNEEEQAALEQEMLALAGSPVRLGGRLTYLGSEWSHAGDGTTRVSWWFRVEGRMGIDYRMFLHGYVKDRSILPEDRRQYEFANFDHDVRPATSRWKRGRIVRHTWSGRIPPGEYRFLFGLYNSKKNARLNLEGQDSSAVEMGWRTIPGSPGS